MEKIILSLLVCGMFLNNYSQNEADPCCSIIATDIKNNLVVARDNITGRLYQFKTDGLDIKAIKINDALNISSGKVTSISGAFRNYPVIQPDKAEPVSIQNILRIAYAEPVSKPRLNNAEPPSMQSAAPINHIVSIQVDPAEPVSKPVINNAEPPSIITAKNKLTGNTYQFKVPAVIAKTLKLGDPAYIDKVNGIQINYAEPVSANANNDAPLNDFAIVQSAFGNSNGQMSSYGYPATSAEGSAGKENATDKWVVTPIPTMKGVLGRLDINFPAGIERNILIQQQSDNKFLTSVSYNDKIYNIAPGVYRFVLSSVPVENVPIQKGHETRLKAGILDLVSEGDWHLYNATKEKAFTSGNKPKKLPLPIGSYQVKLGGQFYPFTIKDGETVEK